MSGYSIDVQNVSKTYHTSHGDLHALRDVSFGIRDGERVGIIGQNGAGKSTLLQVISRVIEPTAGSVHVEGRVHAILAVGMGLREEATGRENLYLDGAVQGRSRAEVSAKLDEMIDFAELGEFIDRPVRTYSTGMKSRLGFASLITLDPEILIIDEALAVGDAFFAGKALEAMRKLTSRGAIVILVSHSLATINDACARAIWMEDGALLMDGPVKEVTQAYRASIHAREADEIARKFGQSGASWAAPKSQCGIASIELVSPSDGSSRNLLEAGEPASIALTLEGQTAGHQRRIRVWAERNDGLIVFDESVEIPAGPVDEGKRRLLVAMDPMDWRPFIYQIHAELLGPAGPTAHSAVTFKIWSDVNVLGGTPMVRTPIQISAKRVGPAGPLT